MVEYSFYNTMETNTDLAVPAQPGAQLEKIRRLSFNLEGIKKPQDWIFSQIIYNLRAVIGTLLFSRFEFYDYSCFHEYLIEYSENTNTKSQRDINGLRREIYRTKNVKFPNEESMDETLQKEAVKSPQAFLEELATGGIPEIIIGITERNIMRAYNPSDSLKIKSETLFHKVIIAHQTTVRERLRIKNINSATENDEIKTIINFLLSQGKTDVEIITLLTEWLQECDTLNELKAKLKISWEEAQIREAKYSQEQHLKLKKAIILIRSEIAATLNLLSLMFPIIK